LDALRQDLPGHLQASVLAAEPHFDWRLSGSVYQYTRFDVLLAMLGGPIIDPTASKSIISELWATSSIFMNDAQEFVRGKDVIDNELRTFPDDEITRRMRLSIRDADALGVYCTCFSAVDDDLSQWRGYGDDGFGVCIEFDLGKLVTGLDGIAYWLIYGKPREDATQRAVALNILSYIHSTIRRNLLHPDVTDAVYNEVREQLTEIWPAVFLAFKHLDFSSEREFRIVYSEAVGRSLPTCYRPSPIVPFVKLEMSGAEKLPITGIRLGPSISSDANVRSLTTALERLGLDHLKKRVKKSDIPYVPQQRRS
jgi:hypothetical protein